MFYKIYHGNYRAGLDSVIVECGCIIFLKRILLPFDNIGIKIERKTITDRMRDPSERFHRMLYLDYDLVRGSYVYFVEIFC